MDPLRAGKFYHLHVELPHALAVAAKDAAVQADTSLNRWVRAAIREKLERDR